ncbi:MAG: 16S rRNA (guanine(527)-N(7))-methyltransferase RsmG [Bacteroidaceae bacterium]|nr:16S rRNA (guanine(527)-N(7))-methyltransferase RsmG [Bacteroidaceae bacterium]
MEIIQKYFPHMTELQVEQFAQLEALYNDWNAKINVISRKDIQNLYEHHVLHSLGIAKVVNFKDGTTVMDLGTGGGFPGIPLAILFPNTQFHLVDSIGKKVKVANEVAAAIGLKNVKFSHARAEEIKEQYDFVATRAVMPMVDLIRVARKNIKREQHNAVPNGIIALKGGELTGEIASMRNISTVWELSDFFEEEYFKTKKVVHVTIVNKK